MCIIARFELDIFIYLQLQFGADTFQLNCDEFSEIFVREYISNEFMRSRKVTA